MRWIEEKAAFDKLFLEARTCIYIDSGREQTTLQRLIFDDAEIRTTKRVCHSLAVSDALVR